MTVRIFTKHSLIEPIMAYLIAFETMRDLLKTGRKALKGDSNDAEHDALYEIVMMLETLRPEGKGKPKRPDAKRP